MVLSILLSTACTRDSKPDFKGNVPFEIVATISTNRIHVGDVVALRVDVRHPIAGQMIDPDRLFSSNLVTLSSAQFTEPPPADASEAVTRYTYELSLYELGTYAVATGMLRCTQSDGKVLEAAFPELNIQVQSVLTNEVEEVRDIAATYALRRRFPVRLAWILAGIAAALLVLAGGGLLLSRRKKQGPKPPPITPPYLLALQALQALRNSPLVKESRFEPFYVEVSDILRRYLERRFHLDAPDMTTEEFMRAAADERRLNSDQKAEVSHFLQQCDLVKFARHVPGQEDMEGVLDAAESFVQETAHAPGTERPTAEDPE